MDTNVVARHQSLFGCDLRDVDPVGADEPVLRDGNFGKLLVRSIALNKQKLPPRRLGVPVGYVFLAGRL